jgi:Predicted AdoMet-dependent methyltransferase
MSRTVAEPDSSKIQEFVALPDGTSDLTATPWDDLGGSENWVDLADLRVATCAGAFWHCIDAWTYDLHFNKTIWRIDQLAEAYLAEDGSKLTATALGPQTTVSKRPRNNAPPDPGRRWIALRELMRKTPAPVGGGADGRDLSYSALEWTAQYVSSATGRHTAVFALVVPEVALADGNARALTMWPFQYPKTRAVTVSYEPNGGDSGEAGGTLRYSVLPLDVGEAAAGRDYEAMKVWAAKSARNFLNAARKRCDRWDPVAGVSTYEKRVVHDRFVDEALYRSHLHRMKQKYGLHWAKNWPEVTDPVKFVYEELSIAAYLVALFEIEQRETGREDKVRFVDVGCGNGFLTYLLLSEGFPGTGIDLQKRGIWDLYPDSVTECLKHEKIDPQTFMCKDVDWIIGNHSDELTPWIPAIAARSLSGDPRAARVRPRFFILPCCFFDLDERKFAAGFMRRTVAVKNRGQGRYEMYLQYIERVIAEFGYSCDRENIRIPSTKYV